MASGCRKSCLMVFGVGGFSSDRCSLAGWCITDSRSSLVPSPTCPAWLSRLTWISWRSITAIFNNSRYPWKTCWQRTGNEPKAKCCSSFNGFVTDSCFLRWENISYSFASNIIPCCVSCQWKSTNYTTIGFSHIATFWLVIAGKRATNNIK